VGFQFQIPKPSKSTAARALPRTPLGELAAALPRPIAGGVIIIIIIALTISNAP